MTFADLYKKATELKLTDSDRRDANIVIVESSFSMRSSMRQTLSGLGFSNISEAPDHALALQKLEQRGVTHLIFEAKKTNMPSKDFLLKALQYDPKIVAIPSSFEPSVDDVFDLLISGARGYVVKPFSSESLDMAILMATKGESISDSILYAKDRNEALVSFMMTALDRASTIMRQAQQFETARHELPKKLSAFKRSVDIARHFAQGGEEALTETLLRFCIERSNGPATRLGRLRKRLNKNKDDDEQTSDKPLDLPAANTPLTK